jgi:hypothetical protein
MILHSMIILIMSLGLGLQYSNSQTIHESKAFPNMQVGFGDQPATKEDGEQTQQAEVGNETEAEQGVVENKTVIQEDSQTAPEQAPKNLSIKQKFGKDLALSNLSQLISYDYKIKIVFRFIQVFEDHDPIGSGCGEWDLTAYVQGKKVSLSDSSVGKALWSVCGESTGGGRYVEFKPGTEVTVDIPAENLEERKDSQPLSIFTVGSEIDGCFKSNLPQQLDEVQKIVADKGSTRPYYAGAQEKIAKIQSEINSDLPSEGCLGNLHNFNDLLGTVNKVYFPPGYGKVGYEGDPLFKTNSSVTVSSSTNDFWLTYWIVCPSCATVRQH